LTTTPETEALVPSSPLLVMPAQAGIQKKVQLLSWIPAFAGITTAEASPKIYLAIASAPYYLTIYLSNGD
jgi:hypothetical protein